MALPMPFHCRRGAPAAFTLIELLIVIGIIGLLLQMLLPAVQSAREAARRAACGTRLRQLGVGVLSHESATRRLPSGGWHFTWIGEPERSTGLKQPGSWVFSILDYIEEPALRSMGLGLTGTDRTLALVARVKTPLPLLLCPSRRAEGVGPYTKWQTPFTLGGPLTQPLEMGAKSDYAANAGDTFDAEFSRSYRPPWGGPTSLEEGDSEEFAWPTIQPPFTGVIYGHSQTTFPQISDGLTKTYLLGEKYLFSGQSDPTADSGDNESVYTGSDNDTCRSTFLTPDHDQNYSNTTNSFGSAHPSVWQAVMCDGSTHSYSYDIDAQTHRDLGNRADGKATELPK